MKILFIVNLNSKKKNGLYVSISKRLTYLRTLGIDFRVICLNQQNSTLVQRMTGFDGLSDFGDFYIENVLYENVVIKNTLIDVIKRKFGIDSSRRFVDEILKKDFHDFDLIHAHWGYPHGYVAYRLSQKLKIPYITTFHGSDIHTILKKKKLIKKLTLKVMKNAFKNFFVSNQLLATAKEFGYSGKNAFVCYNGIDSNTFNSSSIYKSGKKCKTIGFIGSLENVKRADKLSIIFKLIKDRLENVNFLIIGDGSFKKTIEKQCQKYNLELNLINEVPHSEIPQKLKCMDLLILPSRNEGLGMVVLEAYGCGVPVVATNVGGIPEIIYDKNHLVDEDENFEEEFADRVVEVLAEDWSNNPFPQRAKAFDWNRIIAKEVSIYKAICSK